MREIPLIVWNPARIISFIVSFIFPAIQGSSWGEKNYKMLRMSFILLNRKDHKTSGRRKEVSSRGTWKHFAGLLFCCSGRSPKMKELPAYCSYNRFFEMFVCTLCTHLMLLWNIQVLINTLEHKRMIEMLLCWVLFFFMAHSSLSHDNLETSANYRTVQISKTGKAMKINKSLNCQEPCNCQNL